MNKILHSSPLDLPKYVWFSSQTLKCQNEKNECEDLIKQIKAEFPQGSVIRKNSYQHISNLAFGSFLILVAVLLNLSFRYHFPNGKEIKRKGRD
ncbi:hypothetical protein BpHYR1_021782 [Brachionus plicatilis]|uniref:Uncharacterized protein n=1 Tax=Brachionus plicatilis TaxID=10195 RepID=A0A3M7P8B2_BRAPC|nr:hypothetical protein BpHYR1_021782 [Brachionus plicatilis]